MTDIKYLEKYIENKDELKNAYIRLKNGEAVQYIVGNVDFYDYNFIVNKNVLIPRFETEELVSYTIDYANKYFEKPTIIDIGTGSGCIAITLQKKLNTTVYATDISKSAINVAKENAKKNNSKVNFINCNMFDDFNEKVDILISNPPYIAIDDKEIMDIVKNNEPHKALFAPNNGLYFYEKILKDANRILNKKSIIAFEIGYKQANDIKTYARKYFPNAKIVIKKDMSNLDRFIFILNNCE